MLNIKKYANGRFFDTVNKKYIKPEHLAEMIQKGEKIKVTLTKTGKDITSSVIAQFSAKADEKKEKKQTDKKKKDAPFLKTDKLMKWIGEVVDTKIDQVMEIVKLPSREQVARLDENIKALNKKIDELTKAQEKKKKSAAPKKPSVKTAPPEKPEAEAESKKTDAVPEAAKK